MPWLLRPSLSLSWSWSWQHSGPDVRTHSEWSGPSSYSSADWDTSFSSWHECTSQAKKRITFQSGRVWPVLLWSQLSWSSWPSSMPLCAPRISARDWNHTSWKEIVVVRKQRRFRPSFQNSPSRAQYRAGWLSTKHQMVCFEFVHIGNRSIWIRTGCRITCPKCILIRQPRRFFLFSIGSGLISKLVLWSLARMEYQCQGWLGSHTRMDWRWRVRWSFRGAHDTYLVFLIWKRMSTRLKDIKCTLLSSMENQANWAIYIKFGFYFFSTEVYFSWPSHSQVFPISLKPCGSIGACERGVTLGRLVLGTSVVYGFSVDR